MEHTHICDICGKEVTVEDFIGGNYVEMNNACCDDEYCDYRHRDCWDELARKDHPEIFA